MSPQLFDLIIIGAGINGAGIARDASMRGLKVLLLDQADSAWHLKLVYTVDPRRPSLPEYGEVGLVRESLREREDSAENCPAPGEAAPALDPDLQPFTSRALDYARRNDRLRPSLTGKDPAASPNALARRGSAASSGIGPAGLMGAALYYDAQVEFVERLVLENVLSARDNEAVIVSSLQVEEFIAADGICSGVKFRSRLDGRQ